MISTINAVINITLFILVQTFCTYKSTSKYPPALFVYCEFMSKNLTFVYNPNRLFELLRMNSMASAHHTYHFFNEFMASLISKKHL